MRRKLVLFALSLGLTFAAFVHRAEAACMEGNIRNVATGFCCPSPYDGLTKWVIFQCQGGVWVQTGDYFCKNSCFV